MTFVNKWPSVPQTQAWSVTEYLYTQLSFYVLSMLDHPYESLDVTWSMSDLPINMKALAQKLVRAKPPGPSSQVSMFFQFLGTLRLLCPVLKINASERWTSPNHLFLAHRTKTSENPSTTSNVLVYTQPEKRSLSFSMSSFLTPLGEFCGSSAVSDAVRCAWMAACDC